MASQLNISNMSIHGNNPPQRGMQEVDLMTLSIQQLQTLKSQLDTELEFFSESLGQLKGTLTKFNSSKECLDNIGTNMKNNEDVLVPLTSSLYVPGKIAASNEVMIDIGTRYFVKMNNERATDYFKRKIEFVTNQVHKIQELATEKNKIRMVIIEVMELKLKNQQQPS